MTLLLDTHAFLWTAFSPSRLTARAREAILNPNNDVFVSAVTFWEISLKCALGKLELRGATPEEMPDTAVQMGFSLIPLDPSDAAGFGRLPRDAHKDPFDRMLIWQAMQKRCVLVSRDTALRRYEDQGLLLLW